MAEMRLESNLENVMKEKLYITQSIAATKELLQNMSKLPFKSLGMDDFLMAAQAPWIFFRHMAYRYLNHCPEALLEGVEMPQNKDEIHIKQTKDDQVENPAENSLAPSHPIAAAPSPNPIAAACPIPTTRNVRRQLHYEDVQETSTLYVDIQMHSFHPSPLLQRMTSKSYLHQLHINRWMRGLGMNNTFSINLAFFDLPNGLPPVKVDVASKVLQYEGITLVILPRSLFWGGLLATMVENDDSRLVQFT
ncbi:hypothetical protein SELMODRAFT_426660 [Selaginella moellendorffii]|uniref:Uncharacterized protein n=1 Tax=Selaginella moellendorffii TaxID=88036 RepID=D8SX34_SELML|nr:hypothetical protein SELMODRAFT_426660 [Selaginella moellendorffii]